MKRSCACLYHPEGFGNYAQQVTGYSALLGVARSMIAATSTPRGKVP